MRLEHKNPGSNLTLCYQALPVSQSDLEIRRISVISPLVPLCCVGARGFRQLRQLQKSRRCAFVVLQLGRQFANPQEIPLAGIERDQPLQYGEALSLSRVFKGIFVCLDCKFSIRTFENLPKMYFLAYGRIDVPGKLLIGKTGASVVTALYLPFKQLAQKFYSFTGVLQGKTT